MKISYADQTVIIDLTNQGMSNKSICNVTKLPLSTVSYWKRKYRKLDLISVQAKRGAPKRVLSEDEKQLMLAMFASGKTNKEVCTILKLSISTLLAFKKDMQSAGVVFPPIVRKGRPRIIKTCPHCKGIL